MKKRLFALLLALIIMFNLVACGSKTSTDSGSTSSTETLQEERSPSEGDKEEGSGTRVFADDAGREVEIPEKISRIVPTGPMAQIALLAIAPDMFVGLASEFSESDRGIVADNLFGLPYFGQLYGSAGLNVEELAAVNPDVIIDVGETKKTTNDDLDTLQTQTTIPAVFISGTLETMPEAYRKLGQLLGREERAEELAQFCEKVYKRTASIMEKAGEENKVKALYITGDEGLNVIAKTSFHAELIDMLVDNLAVVESPSGKGLGNEVTMDQLLLWNPDFIIFAPKSIYSTVTELNTWDSMTAIKNGNYIETPSIPHNWMGSPPSVQRYLGMIWLPAVLYPDYCDYDVRADIMEYYKLFYGTNLTDEQYDSITANAFLK
ncbi:MAG: ABC transporter substrate-binding protein [Tissierellia bacterium]|nr:ABC transporter substrate-binding protein [Tissierellia bacterium]